MSKKPEDGEVEEEVLDEHQGSLLGALIKQLKIGSDLTKVTLPTFILEPRSFLEKMVDFYSHPEFIFKAVKEEDPLERFIDVVTWFMSGFHVRPKGVKKPYNPILGETFHAHADHDDGTTTTLLCEQVSHHPPISAFIFENREAGFVIEGHIDPKSKFLGNSAASILKGEGKVFLINHEEEYTFSYPTAYVRGIIFGKLNMELGEKINITCEKHNLTAEIEFKTKGFFGGEYNAIRGRIKEIKGKKVFYKLGGHWTEKIYLEDAEKKNEIVRDLFDISTHKATKMAILPEIVQDDFESQKLWTKVTAALKQRPPSQEEATKWKTELEEAQRAGVKERKEKKEAWKCEFFYDPVKNESDWAYKHKNVAPFDAAKEKPALEEAKRKREEKFAEAEQLLLAQKEAEAQKESEELKPETESK